MAGVDSFVLGGPGEGAGFGGEPGVRFGHRLIERCFSKFGQLAEYLVVDPIEGGANLVGGWIFCRVGVGHGAFAEVLEDLGRDQRVVAGGSAADSGEAEMVLSHRLFRLNVQLDWFEKHATKRPYVWETAPGDRPIDESALKSR